MKSTWETYPDQYRFNEVQAILSAACAGECVDIVGPSGAGKSNLLGFLANRVRDERLQMVLVDLNRLDQPTPTALYKLIYQSFSNPARIEASYQELVNTFESHLAHSDKKLCLLFDRFDVLAPGIYNNLRALRDTFKYHLLYVTAARHPLDPSSELAELFFAHTIWLGPLESGDAKWSIGQYTGRTGLSWDSNEIEKIIQLSRGYPAFLRSICEAHAAGARLELKELQQHPAVRRRLDEFWSSLPSTAYLRKSGLEGHLLLRQPSTHPFDTSQLTAKEKSLLEYLLAHSNEICEKDDLIRAVWPEDQVFEQGIRDDSLAQLIHRLRSKIEPDPSNPQYLHNVPGRGYRLKEIT